MIDAGIVIKSIICGYFLTGYLGLLKELNLPLLERSGLMTNPNLFKKIYWVVAWPIHLYIDTYYTHMPDKARATVYAIFTVPIMWAGFSVWGYCILLPHILLESRIISIVLSGLAFLVGSFVLAPILGLLCGALLIALTAPITYFLPKSGNN